MIAVLQNKQLELTSYWVVMIMTIFLRRQMHCYVHRQLYLNQKNNNLEPLSICPCCCQENNFTADPVLIMTEIPILFLNQGSLTHSNVMRSVQTIWKPGLFGAGCLCPTQGCKWGYLVFDRKRLEPRVLSWQWHNRCHFVFL